MRRTSQRPTTRFRGQIADLAGQAGKVTQGTDLVTILMGANDACTKTEAAMTPVADFRTAQIQHSRLSPAGASSRSWSPPFLTCTSCGRLARDPPPRGSSGACTASCQSILKSPSSSLKADQGSAGSGCRASSRGLRPRSSQRPVAPATIPCNFDGNAVLDASFDPLRYRRRSTTSTRPSPGRRSSADLAYRNLSGPRRSRLSRRTGMTNFALRSADAAVEVDAGRRSPGHLASRSGRIELLAGIGSGDFEVRQLPHGALGRTEFRDGAPQR